MQKRKRSMLLAGFLILFLASPGRQVMGTSANLLQAHFIDVGQGDAILIQAPDGASALIDGGEPNGKALAYLQGLGVDAIDVMVATHPHDNHVGGLAEVMESLPVGALWTSGAAQTSEVFERFSRSFAERGIRVQVPQPGERIPLGELEFEVLHVQPQAENLNETSIVLKLSYGDVSFLFTGDAEDESEARMLSMARDKLAVTILKVAHHGSDSSTTPPFVAAARPQLAIYSAGADNPFGHPNQEPLSNLAAVGATVLGTDQHGTVVVSTDGETYSVRPATAQPPVVLGTRWIAGIPATQGQLLRPISGQTFAAQQAFERGMMFWLQFTGQIWVLEEDGSGGGRWRVFEDRFVEGQPERSPNLQAPPGLFQPARGFGKLWRENPDVRAALGWAREAESGFLTAYIYLPGGALKEGAYTPAPGSHEIAGTDGRLYRLDEATGRWEVTALSAPTTLACQDFSAQLQAQLFFEASLAAASLDVNGNGIACEGLP